jgi:subtilisin family serine protease
MFTVMVENAWALERIQDFPEVKAVTPLSNRVFKVETYTDTCDRTMERWRAIDIGGICHHAYRLPGKAGTRYYLTDRINIKFAPHTKDAQVDDLLQRGGLRLWRDYPERGQAFTVQVTSAARRNPLKIANALAARDDVVYAEPDLVERFQTFHLPIPGDTLFSRQWHLRSWKAPQLVDNADVSAMQAWQITRGSRDIVVAVLDNGFDLSHPDFRGAGKVVYAKDYVDGDGKPFSSPHGSHGTSCAGMAIAEANGMGVVGIAPGCAFMPVRMPLQVPDHVLVDIFDYAGRYADVIVCGWGPPPVYAPMSSLLAETLAHLARHGGPRGNGCVICVAAGNADAPIDAPDDESLVWCHPVHGLLTSTGPILNGYATHPDVIAVAANTSLNRKAAYSHWGQAISVSAPSNNAHPLHPGQPVAGRGIWTTATEQYDLGLTSSRYVAGQFGGTSCASSLVAGVAALVRSVNPQLSALEVKAVLEQTADKIADPEPQGMLSLAQGVYDTAGHSAWFGYGKVNAASAVQRAQDVI